MNVGEEKKIGNFRIECGAVEKFNNAVSYPRTSTMLLNAKTDSEGSNIQLPTFIMTLGWGEFLDTYSTLFPISGGVHGGSEFEYYHPVKIGDVISVKVKYLNIEHREGKKAGNMHIDKFEMFYNNLSSELVGKSIFTLIRFSAEQSSIE